MRLAQLVASHRFLPGLGSQLVVSRLERTHINFSPRFSLLALFFLSFSFSLFPAVALLEEQMSFSQDAIWDYPFYCAALPLSSSPLSFPFDPLEMMKECVLNVGRVYSLFFNV